MKSFDYVVPNPMVGYKLADMVVMIKNCQSEVFITKGERRAYAGNIMEICALGVNPGDHLIFSVEGPDEEEVTEKLKQHCKEVFSK